VYNKEVKKRREVHVDEKSISKAKSTPCNRILCCNIIILPHLDFLGVCYVLIRGNIMAAPLKQYITEGHWCAK
jgi:hypothetical protein